MDRLKFSTEQVPYISKHLPDLVSLTGKSFASRYKDLAEVHETVFPQHDRVAREGIDPLPLPEFQKKAEGVSQHHQELVRELGTLLVEIEKNDDRVNGDPLWLHQKALVFEFIQHLVQGRFDRAVSSLLLMEAPGTGKTRLMGLIVQALTRLQIRGLFDKNILILIKRQALVAQQAWGEHERRDALMTSEPSHMREAEIREQRKYVLQYLDTNVDFFPSDVWRRLCLSHPKSTKDALTILKASLQERNLLASFERFPNAELLLEDCAQLLSRNGAIILGPNRSDLEFMKLTPPTSSPPDRAGDFLFGVEQQIRDRNELFIQTSYGDHETKKALVPDDVRIAVVSRMSLLQHSSRVRIGKFLKNVGWIFVDEAGLSSAGGFEEMVIHKDIGGEKPHVLAANAFNRDGRLRYDATMSHFSAEQGMNSADKVLQPSRLDSFPANGEPRYSSGSYEAAEQFIDYYGRILEMPNDRDLPQPTDGPHIVIQDRKTVQYVTQRLKQQFGDKGIHFISFDANRSDEDKSGRIQLRMNDPVHERTCLIACLDNIADSYDFRNLQATFYCVQENKMSLEGIRRAGGGRQFHTKRPNGFIIQQQFANPTYRNNTVWNAYDLDIPVPDSGEWDLVPGQYILGQEACEAEAKALKNTSYATRKLWSRVTTREFEEHSVLAGGEMPPSIEEQNQLWGTSAIAFPPLNDTALKTGAGIDENYIEAFARANGLGQFTSELMKSARKAGRNVRAQCESLRMTAIRCAEAQVTHISEETQGRMAGNRSRTTRSNTPAPSIEPSQKRSPVAASTVVKAPKAPVSPRPTPEPKAKKVPPQPVKTPAKPQKIQKPTVTIKKPIGVVHTEVPNGSGPSAGKAQRIDQIISEELAKRFGDKVPRGIDKNFLRMCANLEKKVSGARREIRRCLEGMSSNGNGRQSHLIAEVSAEFAVVEKVEPDDMEVPEDDID